MDERNWSQYSVILKEGFLRCKEYLQDKFNLLENASLELKDSFSIEYILKFCMDENQIKDLTFYQRKDFAKALFEIYFNYSKNLLLYFDIYSEKSIKIDNYLSRFPQHPDHLALIGYSYQNDDSEWKYSEPRLTKRRRDTLQFITVVCCLGYSYIDTPLKFLQLTIFERRRESLQNLIKDQSCEYCNFELNKIDFRCSVCNGGIENMEFFKHWEKSREFEISTHANNNSKIDDGYESNVPSKQVSTTNEVRRFSSLPVPDIGPWQCSRCSFSNKSSNITCCVCFSQKEDENVNYTNNSSNQSLNNLKDENDITSPQISHQATTSDLGAKRYSSLPVLPVQTWQCSTCTLVNRMSSPTCCACMNFRENVNVERNVHYNFEDIEPDNDIHDEDDSSDCLVSRSTSNDTWQCSGCTFNNQNSVVICEACLKGKFDSLKLTNFNLNLSRVKEESILSCEKYTPKVIDVDRNSCNCSSIDNDECKVCQATSNQIIHSLSSGDKSQSLTSIPNKINAQESQETDDSLNKFKCCLCNIC